MIIDTFSGLPNRHVLGSWLRSFTPYPGYVRQFAQKIAPAMGISSDELVARFDSQGIAKTVDQMLDAMSDTFMDLDLYVSVMDGLSIQAQGVWLHVEAGDIFSQPAVLAAAEAVKKYPDRFFLLPSFEMTDDLTDRVQAFEDRIGLAGVTTLAFIDNLFPDDPAFTPLYEKLVELDKVLWNHTVNSWSARHPSEIGHPRYVDRIACRYPSLRIVMGHGGWPWVLEAMTVARRHPNVCIEPSSHRWKHLARPGSGWEPLLYYGNWIASDKVLFASMWQLQGLPPAVVIEEARSLPLSPETLAKWTYENARRFYRL